MSDQKEMRKIWDEEIALILAATSQAVVNFVMPIPFPQRCLLGKYASIVMRIIWASVEGSITSDSYRHLARSWTTNMV